MNHLMWLFECDQIVAVQSGWALNPFQDFSLDSLTVRRRRFFPHVFRRVFLWAAVLLMMITKEKLNGN